MLNPQQIVWAALIAAQCVIVLPIVVSLFKKDSPMAVSAAAQALVDELNAAVAQLSTALANADAKATAQSAEDLAAIKTAADALVAAINIAATPAQ